MIRANRLFFLGIVFCISTCLLVSCNRSNTFNERTDSDTSVDNNISTVVVNEQSNITNDIMVGLEELGYLDATVLPFLEELTRLGEKDIIDASKIQLNSYENIGIYEYNDKIIMENHIAAAILTSPIGAAVEIDSQKIPMYHFSKNNILVVYMGTDSKILELLHSRIGMEHEEGEFTDAKLISLGNVVIKDNKVNNGTYLDGFISDCESNIECGILVFQYEDDDSLTYYHMDYSAEMEGMIFKGNKKAKQHNTIPFSKIIREEKNDTVTYFAQNKDGDTIKLFNYNL